MADERNKKDKYAMKVGKLCTEKDLCDRCKLVRKYGPGSYHCDESTEEIENRLNKEKS